MGAKPWSGNSADKFWVCSHNHCGTTHTGPSAPNPPGNCKDSQYATHNWVDRTPKSDIYDEVEKNKS